MSPVYTLRLGADSFHGATTSCDGPQLAALVAVIESVKPDLVWYAADTQVIGPGFRESRGPDPVRIGDSNTLRQAANAIVQFESGVFLAVPPQRTPPRFRDEEIWTDDDDTALLGDAVLEVRMFDTTYIHIATNDRALFTLLRDAAPYTVS